MKLTQVLKKIADETDGDNTSINEIVELLENRGFGPLIIAPALIALLPTGAIPTVPSICAICIVIIVVQILAGKKHPWLPKKMKEVEIERSKLKAGVEHFTPYTKKVDKVFKPRFTFLMNEIGKRIIAIVAAITALLMIPLELIPFAAALPAAAIVLMGLGMSTKDGLMSFIGTLLSAASVYLVVTQML